MDRKGLYYPVILMKDKGTGEQHLISPNSEERYEGTVLGSWLDEFIENEETKRGACLKSWGVQKCLELALNDGMIDKIPESDGAKKISFDSLPWQKCLLIETEIGNENDET